MILIIDNYDSFVYNLAQFLGELGEKVRVVRNDQVSMSQIENMQPSHIVISPGPGIPKEAGKSCKVISCFAGKIPILGVCLGHQSIGEVFGARVIRADKVMHGKVSKIFHDGEEIYQGVKNPFIAARYHSLIVEEKSLPDSLKVTAWTCDGIVMGVRHKRFTIEGVQFHPESIMTKVGKRILSNFIRRYSRNYLLMEGRKEQLLG